MSNSPLVTYTNITKNKNSPRNHAIDRITIHVIVAQWTAKQCCDYFATTPDQSSANYCVGKDGSIGLSVDEADRSWCSSSSANDHRAVTIETASDTKHPYAVTDKAYVALLDLVTDICKRNGKKKLLWFGDKDKTLAYEPAADEMVMTVHRWFANKACPGDYLYERHGAIAEEVNRRLGAPDTDAVATLRYVQTGAFGILKNAQAHAEKVRAAGFEAILKKSDGLYKVQTGAFAQVANANAMAAKLKAKGFSTYITTRGGEIVTEPDALKPVDEIAKEVIAGKWGNGADRKKRLTDAGYDYAAVQACVNKLL